MIYEDFLAQFTDWRPTALYWQRFSIAEKFGLDEIDSVYKDIFSEAKNDYKLLTELVMVLNHKTWEHSEYIRDSEFSKVYSGLFYDTQKYAEQNLKDDELKYYLDVTD